MLNIFKKNKTQESKLKGFSDKVQILNQEETRKVIGGGGGGTSTPDPSDAAKVKSHSNQNNN
jgi:hypothetical protein